MKTIFFHIGSGRCGSTAIQGVFNEQVMITLLRDHGLEYVPELYIESEHLTPVLEFDRAVWEPLRKKYFLPMLKAPFSGYFLTQENLLGISWEADMGNTYANSCKTISYLTDGFDTKIIIIVRRQDTFIESIYNQLLKRGERRAFSQYLDEFPKENYRWNRVADAFADVFGHDNITVIPFEKHVIRTSGVNDFFCAIIRVLGIKENIDFSTLPTINPSLSPRVLELQRLANEVLTKEEAHGLSDWFEANIGKRHDASHNLISEDQRKAIIDFYIDDNRSLFETYIPACLPDYYVSSIA